MLDEPSSVPLGTQPASTSSTIGRTPVSNTTLRVVGLVASLAALIWVVRSIDVSETARLLAAAQLSPIAACLLIVAAEVILRSIRWRLLLPAPATGTRIPLLRIAQPMLIGYLGNAVLPARLGEAIRAVLIARREHIELADAVGSVLLERVVDTETLAVMVWAAASLFGAPAWIVNAAGSVAAIGGIGLVALITVGLSPVARGVSDVVGRLLPGRAAGLTIMSRVIDFARGIDRRGRPRSVGLAGLISAVCWGLDATTFMLVTGAVGATLSPAAAMIMSGIATLGTAVPAAPGYVGTFELAAAAAGTAVGLPASTGLAVGIIVHAITVLPPALGGWISLVVTHAGLSGLAITASGDGTVDPPASSGP